jgi:antitoxin ParD1/3/4
MVAEAAPTVEQRKIKNTAKLEGLRSAARSGMAALDRGDFREFADAHALVAYLGDLAAVSLVRMAGRSKP